MAQVPIREYDAKRMFADALSLTYSGVLITKPSDLENLDLSKKYVIKPDQLFGKRGKYGLVGVNLSPLEVREWWKERVNQTVTLWKVTGKLTTFLVEPYVAHSEEYYLAFHTERSHDTIYFSRSGGIDIEENWSSVSEVQLPLGTAKEDERSLVSPLFGRDEDHILDFVMRSYDFFVAHGLSSLEINPFTFDQSGEAVCLDMVASLDTSEEWRQKEAWKAIEFVHPFGIERTESEDYIDTLDKWTGASLKFRLLNSDGAIWLLTSGGGASVVLIDTIADLWYAEAIGNYGECSGNPDRESTKAYTLTLLDHLIASSSKKQYLIVAGAIANFTHIDKTFAGVIDAISERLPLLKSKDLTVLVRRGGINDTLGLEQMKLALTNMEIPCKVADGNTYMTDILSDISLDEPA